MPDIDFTYTYGGQGIKWTDERLEQVKKALEETKEEERHVGEPNSDFLRKEGEFYISRRTGEQVASAAASLLENIALQDADRMLRGRPVMPENESVTVRFPGISPVGKTCAMEMQFAQRLANIKAVAQIRPPEVTKYVNELLALNNETSENGRSNKAYNRITNLMRSQMEMARVSSRAAKICPSASGRAELRTRSRLSETEGMTEQFELYLQGLEHVVGIDPRAELPEEVTNLYTRVLETPLNGERYREKRDQVCMPQAYKVEFENTEDMLFYKASMRPGNWGLSEAEIRKKLNGGPEERRSLHLTDEEIDNTVVTYARATVDRAIHPLFDELERTEVQTLNINRGDYIIVDGKTVRERMLEEYLAGGGEIAGFEQHFKDNSHQKTNEYVAAALMAGKRVEAFVPDKFGRLPKEPTQIVKNGYTPAPIQKVTLNAWERFFAKRGFYKEKAAKAAEYQQFQEARERVRLHNFCGCVELDVGSATAREPYFGAWSRENGGAVHSRYNAADEGAVIAYSTSRTAEFSTAVCCMAAMGHKLEDIFDNTKLLAQKEQVGREVMRRFEANDHIWLLSAMHHGQIAIADDMDRIIAERKIHIEDERELFREENRMLFMAAKVQFDVNQEVERAETKGAFPLYSPVVRQSMPPQMFEGLTPEQEQALVNREMAAVRARSNASSQYFDGALHSLKSRLGIFEGDSLSSVDNFSTVLGNVSVFEAMRRNIGGKLWGKESRAPELLLRDPETQNEPVSLAVKAENAGLSTCYDDREYTAIRASVAVSAMRNQKNFEQLAEFRARPEKYFEFGRELISGETQKKLYIELRGKDAVQLRINDDVELNASPEKMKKILPKVEEKKQPEKAAPAMGGAGGRTR